jgi:phosphoenolpyruvate---glycerone phosphotransferase subunit DhaL
MDERLTTQDLSALLQKTCLDMEAAQEELQELDGSAGDGDLGVTVKLGFQAVRMHFVETAGSDIGSLLSQAGVIFNKAAASTFGTLMAIALMRAGRTMKGKTSADLNDLGIVIRAAVKAVTERGGAAEGDCTMLDALIPAQQGLMKLHPQTATLKEASAKAAEASLGGALATAGMTPKHGRAGWLSGKPRGTPDAGAMAIALMLKALARHFGTPCAFHDYPEGKD